MAAIDKLRVLADWGRTAAFDHALSDITNRVLSAQWSWGFPTPDQLVAPPASGTILLDNADGAFNLGKTGAAFAGLLKLDTLIRFQHGATVLMTLRVRGIDIAPGVFGPRVVTLALEDWHAELMQAQYDPPLTLNTTTGTAISNAWDAGLVGMPYNSRWWVMGASLMGIDTRMYDPSESYSGDTGQTTLEYVGDNIDKGNGTPLYGFIEEMCAAELDGRFLYTPSGKYKFRDRHAIARAVSLGTIQTVRPEWLLDSAQYSAGAGLLNTLEVTLYPRKVGSAGTELARTTSAASTPGLGNRELSLRYRDPDAPDATCAATTIIQPVASTDYTGNLAADGTGEDYTGNLVVSVENLTNAAKVTVNNTALGTVYLTMLKIRGTPLSALQPVKVRGVDPASVRDYGRHSAQRTVAGVNNTELVEQYANYVVRRRATPLTGYRQIAFDMPEGAADPLWSIAFPDDPLVLRVIDPAIEDTASTRIQQVAGVAHAANRETGWQVSYALEDAIQLGGWVMGDAVLGIMGVTTIPIF